MTDPQRPQKEKKKRTPDPDFWQKTSDHPSTRLKTIAKSHNVAVDSVEFARLLDSDDPLSSFRSEFHYPSIADLDLKSGSARDDSIYLCGQSLGLQPKSTRSLVLDELDKWEKKGVRGHAHVAQLPWVTIESTVKEASARLVGALPSEVCIMNTLSVNLHVGMLAFYRPTSKRYKIMLEAKAFPSDHYAIQSQIQVHGYDPNDSLVIVAPRPGEETLRTEDIVKTIEEQGDAIALILFGGVQYYTGQVLDMARITEAGHKRGCHVGFDLAHAIGNVPLRLHDWHVDFACWCTYKYLNAGPGAIGGFFVHDTHARDFSLPRMEGWWGHDLDTRFRMDNTRALLPGADGFQSSNPPVLETVCLLSSLRMFNRTSIEQLRAKSVHLTGYLELLLNILYSKDDPNRSGPYVELITPRNVDERGAQLSIRFSVPLKKVFDWITERGVVVDLRKPDVMRVGPMPFYNSFEDVHKFVRLLGEAFSAVG